MPVTADNVVTQVLDPLNRQVEHSHTEPKGDFEFTTTITFMPLLHGSYHLTARFEPSIGIAQLDVQVGVDRSNTPSKDLELGVQCTALEVMPGDLVLCLTADNKLKLFRDELLVQMIDADEFATAGDVVWTTRLGVIQRRLNLGGSMPLGSLLTFDSKLLDQGDTGTLIATNEEAVLVTARGSVKVRTETTNLIEVSRATTDLSSPYVVYLTENLDRLILMNSQKSSQDFGRICFLQLSNPSHMATCKKEMSPGFYVLGSDKTGVWSRDIAGLRHHAFGADGGLVTSAVAIRDVGPVVVSRHFENAPTFLFGTISIVPRFGPDGILLDLYELEPGFTAMPSSVKTFRAQHADGRQRLYAR